MAPSWSCTIVSQTAAALGLLAKCREQRRNCSLHRRPGLGLVGADAPTDLGGLPLKKLIQGVIQLGHIILACGSEPLDTQ